MGNLKRQIRCEKVKNNLLFLFIYKWRHSRIDTQGRGFYLCLADRKILSNRIVIFLKDKERRREMGSEGEDGSEMLQFSPKTKKIIQNLEEIVNSSESEIYWALKDCNMDPNEAVQRLLSQGSFFCLLYFFYLLVLFEF